MAKHPSAESGRNNAMFTDDLLAVLLESVAPVAPDVKRAARMRNRILEGIGIQAHANADYYTVPREAGTWMSIDPKLEVKILYKDSRSTSFLLRLKPGARLPSHVHAADEECLVLEGELWLGEGTRLKAGDYHFAPKGLPHGVATSPSGALLFLRSEKPAYR